MNYQFERVRLRNLGSSRILRESPRCNTLAGCCSNIGQGSLYLNTNAPARARRKTSRATSPIKVTYELMFSSFARTAARFLTCLSWVAALALASSAYAQGFVLVASPIAVDFGNTLVGSTTTQTVTLSNLNDVGSAAVNVSQLALQNSPASIARSGGTCPAMPFALTSGASCTVQLSFAPTVVGLHSATLQVVADTGNFTVAVSGSGVIAAPLPTFAPSQLNFGLFSIQGGATPVTQTVTISNPGGAPLDLLGLTGAVTSALPTTDRYQVTGGSCVSFSSTAIAYVLNTPLAAGASCTLQVSFLTTYAPIATSYDRALVVQTAAGDISIPMIASVGVLFFPIVVSPSVVTFSSVSVSAEMRIVMFTNPAPVLARITSFNLPSGYMHAGGSCATPPFALAPAANCTIIVSRPATTAAVAASHLKSASYIDVPVVATTGNANLRIEVAAQPLVNVSFATLPAGLGLVVNDQLRATPFTLQVEAGTNVTVDARAQNRGNSGYAFASWSDSGAVAHTVVAQNPGPTLTATFLATPFVAKLDVDNDGLVNAATDGMLVVRYLLGMRGAALIDGLPIPANAERRDAASITAYLDAIRTDLDVEGVGGASAMTDGILIVRYMLGLTGTALTQGASAVGAQSPTQIQNKLDAMRP